jgi:tape measure domain-containing protein
MNIAELGFKVDVSGISDVSIALDGMVRSASSAEAAAARIEKSVNSANKVFSIAKQAIKLFAGSLDINQLISYADTWSDLNSRLLNATGSQAAADKAMRAISDTASTTYSSLEQIANVFLRNSQVLNELGYSTEKQIAFSKVMNEALAVSGTEGQVAESVMNAFSKALAAGSLRGINFNTVLQSGGRVTQALADGLGVTTLELQNLAEKGLLTTDKVFNALISQEEKVNAEAKTMPATFSGGFMAMGNAALELVGRMDQLSGVTGGIGSTLKDVSESIRGFAQDSESLGNVMEIAKGAVIILGSAYTASLIPAFWNSIKVMGSQVVATLSATGVYNIYTRQLMVAATAQNTLSSSVAGVGGAMKLAFGAVGVAIGALALWAISSSNAKKSTIDLNESIDDITKKYRGMGDAQRELARINALKDMRDAQRELKDAQDQLYASNKSMQSGVRRNAHDIEQAAKSNLEYRAAVETATQNVNRFKVSIDALNAVDASIRQAAIDSWYRFITGADLAKDAVHRFSAEGQGIADSLQQQVELLGKTEREAFVYQNTVMKGVDTAHADYDALKKQAEGLFDLTKSYEVAKKAKDEAARSTEALRSGLAPLLAQLNPIEGGTLAMAESEKILNQALDDGKIKAEQMGIYMGVLSRQYKEVIDPLGTMLEGMGCEYQMLQLNSKEREIQNELYQRTHDLQQKGKELTGGQAAAIEAQIRLEQEEQKLSQTRDAIFAETVGKQEQLIRQQQALNQLRTDGTITQDQYNQRMIETNAEMAKMRLDAGTGDWTDAALNGLYKFQEGFTTVFSGFSDAMGDFFTSFTDGFANSIGKAIVMGDSLKESLGSIAKEALSQLISALVKVGIQWAVTNALQSSTSIAAIAATTTASTTAAVETATAWAPAAGLSTLGSFGSNIGPALLGIGAVLALVKGFGGFSEGGYTGNGGRSQVAGYVHGQEFVMNAEATLRNRGVLEAMNSGYSPASSMPRYAPAPERPSSGGAPNINITVDNSSRAQVDIQQFSETDIRILVREESRTAAQRYAPEAVAATLDNPNSVMSKSLGRNLEAQRRR